MIPNRLRGQVQGNLVSLRYRGSLLEKRDRKSFYGRLIADASGSRLVGRFGSPTSLVIILGWTIGILAITFGTNGSALEGWPLAGKVAVLVFVLLVPWVFVLRDVPEADADLRRITEAVTEACDL